MITIGADPEGFLSLGGKIVPVTGLLGGTKDKPMKVKCGAVQEDNVLAEFNIDPASDEDTFVSNIQTVIEQMKARIKGYNFEVVTAHTFTDQSLKLAGPSSMVFGCDTDYNSWRCEPNPPTQNATGLRTAGGHIHVGYPDAGDTMEAFRISCMMDIYITLPSIMIAYRTGTLGDENNRRIYYGKAGSCRIKPYGVEHRTPSNFWLRSESLMRWVYRNTTLAYENRYMLEDIVDYNSGVNRIQDIINYGLRPGASRIIREFKIPMPEGY